MERRLATLEDGRIISVNKRQVDSNESADSGPNGPKCSRSDTGGRLYGRPQRYHDVSESETDDDELALSAMFQGVKNLDKNVAIDASHDKNDDNWLWEMDDEGETEYGPPVHDKVAVMANKRFDKPQSLQRIKDLKTLYPTPNNCEGVAVPKVNSEVWHNLSKKTNRSMKIRDLKLAGTQSSIVTASSAVLKIMNALTQASKARPTAAKKASGSKLDGSSLEAVDVEELFKVGLHALTLLGHANYELSRRRRESMKPLLKDDLAAALCGPDIPVTKFLFGDEFSKSLKEAKQIPQMGRNSGRGQGQGRRYDQYHQSKNYRGRGGKWSRPWKPQYQKDRSQYKKGKRTDK